MYFRGLCVTLMSCVAVCLFAQEANESLLPQDSIQDKQREIYMLRGQEEQLKKEKEAQENLQPKSGFFVGGVVGNSAFVNEANGKTFFTYPIVLGAKGGYQKFITGTQAGVRAYVDYLTGLNEVERRNYFYQNGAFNFDFMGDIMLDRMHEYGLSLFGGFGLGVLGLSAGSLQDYYLGVFVNLGAGVVLNLQHRVNLHLKIPPVKDFGENIRIGNMFLISYEYVF